MKLSTFVLPALCVFTGVQADVEKRCTIGLSVECWYNGFNAQNQQYRCAVPGQYAVAYAFGLCPSTYGGYNYVKGECITAGKYNGRHKCRDGFNPAIVERQALGENNTLAETETFGEPETLEDAE